MIQQDRLDPRTTQPENSIWQSVSEDTFRHHLVVLEEKTNAVPVQPQVFPLDGCSSSRNAELRLLPIEIEQKLADDFAYIAAVGEGAQSVAAACIEESFDSKHLCVRLAAIDSINEQLQESFQKVGFILTRHNTATSRVDDASDFDDLLKLIAQQHFQKLLGRLRSNKWQKPKYLSRTHKKSLGQDFDNLIHRVQFIYPKKKNTTRTEVETQLHAIAKVIQTFEDIPSRSNKEFLHLLEIIRACYSFCKNPAISLYAAELESLPNATPQIAGAIKTLRQVEKIGAYFRIAVDLVKISRKYPTLFSNLRFVYLNPYSATETDIGFESWAKTLHVHAEIQLTVHYDLHESQQRVRSGFETRQYFMPRVIGTSKYLCYLCYHFIKCRGMFYPSNTHGRLYDQWTIPDLAEYDEEIRRKYRQVIDTMDAEVVNLTNRLRPRQGKRDVWRVEPMTSRQNLLLDVSNQPSICKNDSHTTSSVTENVAQLQQLTI